MNRRKLLTGIAGTAAVAGCSLCLSAAARASSVHWGYEGEAGSEHWASLDEGYAACGHGQQQSPINLTDPVSAVVRDVEVHWAGSQLNVVNNGHTIQANTDAGSYSVIGGKRFDLKQFHFHHPSEHQIAGRSFPMEAHFVHAAADGALAVLGVMMAEGAANETIDKVWRVMPKSKGEASDADTIAPAHLLPASRAFYRYTGSLTTPPCSEIVTWTVYADPIEVSGTQVKAFAGLFPNNARPIQQLHRRFLLGNF